MIYSPLTQKAMILMFEGHKDQKDKSGVPYVFHPFHVAEQMEDEMSCAVALLHDLVEDTPCTIGELRRQGFPDAVCDAVALLTHEEGVPYMDYIRRIKGNPLAVKVKLADLMHNSDPTRLPCVTPADQARMQKYQAAMALLTE